MKKRILGTLMLCLLFWVPSIEVLAEVTASASISISTSSTVVGNSGTATLTVSSNEKIGQIWGKFTCGGLGSKDLTYSIGPTDTPSNSRSYTINWKASKSGTYTCKVEGLEVGTLESVVFLNPSVTSKTINVISASSGGSSSGASSGGASSSSSGGSSSGGTTTNKKQYSSDNTLKSLSIDDYELVPNFDKNTTEYKLKVDQSIEKIKINATANDKKASVNGGGEVSLSSGENTFEIKVTAENGNDKVYKIIVTVDDLNPIKVKIGDNEYTVVKKNNDLVKPLDHYEEITLNINEQETVAYENLKTKVVLVLLKDKDNKINYYIYDSEKNTYELYRFINVNGVVLQLIDIDEKLEHYKKYTLELQEQKIDYYKLKGSHKVGLIYGTNVKTGNTGYYVYDKNEETLSKYYNEEIKLYQNDVKELKNYLMIFMGAIAFVSIVIIIISLQKTKKANKKRYKI